MMRVPRKTLERLGPLQTTLKYRFQDVRLLAQALTHPSYAHEDLAGNSPDNERLEFLGDAVLSLGITHMIMERLPDRSEGELTRVRASMVNKRALAEVARRMGLGRFVRLGKGEDRGGGRDKASVLADCFEAVVGAIYLDGGYEKTLKMLETNLADSLRRVIQKRHPQDNKSQLQESVQNQNGTIPRYILVRETGPDHEKQFCVTVSVGGVVVGRGEGKTKKQAEQRAAEQALGELMGRGI
jgi:ribonuclease-3